MVRHLGETLFRKSFPEVATITEVLEGVKQQTSRVWTLVLPNNHVLGLGDEDLNAHQEPQEPPRDARSLYPTARKRVSVTDL